MPRTQGPPLAVEADGHRRPDPPPHPVGRAREATAAPDHSVPARLEDDVDPLPAEVGALVERARLARCPRSSHAGGQLDDRTERGRPLGRGQLELRLLAQSTAGREPDPHGQPDGELAPAPGAEDLGS